MRLADLRPRPELDDPPYWRSYYTVIRGVEVRAWLREVDWSRGLGDDRWTDKGNYQVKFVPVPRGFKNEYINITPLELQALLFQIADYLAE